MSARAATVGKIRSSSWHTASAALRQPWRPTKQFSSSRHPTFCDMPIHVRPSKLSLWTLEEWEQSMAVQVMDPVARRVPW